jgi:hypothetical protein
MTFDWNTSRKVSALGVGSPGNTSGVNTNPIGCAETSCDPLPTTASSSATPTTAMRRGQDVCLFMIGSSSGSGLIGHHTATSPCLSSVSPAQHPLAVQRFWPALAGKAAPGPPSSPPVLDKVARCRLYTHPAFPHSRGRGGSESAARQRHINPLLGKPHATTAASTVARRQHGIALVIERRMRYDAAAGSAIFQPFSATFSRFSADVGTFRRIGHSRSPGQTSPRRYLWLTLARRPPWIPWTV